LPCHCHCICYAVPWLVNAVSCARLVVCQTSGPCSRPKTHRCARTSSSELMM
jgi:hypothetical protein